MLWELNLDLALEQCAIQFWINNIHPNHHPPFALSLALSYFDYVNRTWLILPEVTDTHEYANETDSVFYLHLLSFVLALPLDPLEYIIVFSLYMFALLICWPSFSTPPCKMLLLLFIYSRHYSVIYWLLTMLLCFCHAWQLHFSQLLKSLTFLFCMFTPFKNPDSDCITNTVDLAFRLSGVTINMTWKCNLSTIPIDLRSSSPTMSEQNLWEKRAQSMSRVCLKTQMYNIKNTFKKSKSFSQK